MPFRFYDNLPTLSDVTAALQRPLGWWPLVLIAVVFGFCLWRLNEWFWKKEIKAQIEISARQRAELDALLEASAFRRPITFTGDAAKGFTRGTIMSFDRSSRRMH